MRGYRRLPSAHHRAPPGRHIARDSPELDGDIDGIDAELQPEPDGAAVVLAAMTAILPDRLRAAQRHEVPMARQNSEPRKPANVGAF